MTCSTETCERPVKARGLCNLHYKRAWKKTGPLPKQTLEQRFWAKVDKTDGCWLWTASLDGRGYGRFHNGDRLVPAHRFAYELLISAVPAGLELDHLCRVHPCVNPAHLEPVTHRENICRGEAPTAVNARKTHCVHGHLFDEGNVRFDRLGGRHCRRCEAIHHQNRKNAS